jgi:hypothetical protein
MPSIHQITVGQAEIRTVNIKLHISTTHIVVVSKHRNELVEEVTCTTLMHIITIGTARIEVCITVGFRINGTFYYLNTIIYNVMIEAWVTILPRMSRIKIRIDIIQR